MVALFALLTMFAHGCSGDNGASNVPDDDNTTELPEDSINSECPIVWGGSSGTAPDEPAGQPTGRTWSALSTNGMPTGKALSAMTHTDEFNNSVVIWVNEVDDLPQLYSFHIDLSTNEIIDIGQLSDGLGAVRYGLNTNGAGPVNLICFAMADNGGAAVSYLQDFDNRVELVVAFYNPSSRSWLEPQVIQSSATDILSHTVAINDNGQAALSWLEDREEGLSIQATIFTGLEWSSPITLNEDDIVNSSWLDPITSHPTVAVLPSGQALIGWADGSSGSRQLQMRVLDGSDVFELSAPSAGLENGSPTFIVSNNNYLGLSWVAYSQDNQFFSSVFMSTFDIEECAWKSPTKVSQIGLDQHTPSVDINGIGEIAIGFVLETLASVSGEVSAGFTIINNNSLIQEQEVPYYTGGAVKPKIQISNNEGVYLKVCGYDAFILHNDSRGSFLDSTTFEPELVSCLDGDFSVNANGYGVFVGPSQSGQLKYSLLKE